jgi:hypothetical protein
MHRKSLLVGVVGAFALAAPASAGAAPRFTWGQEVKACNQTHCYPGGTSRGEYVSGQARDGEGPGYAWEIQTLALDPRDLGSNNGPFGP